MTIKSMFSASRLRAVSLRVSPFFSEEASVLKLMMSAERRCSESSKLVRVRVEGSTNRLTTVLPRRAGTFLMARSPTALKARAVSSTVVISSTVRDSMSSRCLRCQLIGGRGMLDWWIDGLMEEWRNGVMRIRGPSLSQCSNTPIPQHSGWCSFLDYDFVRAAHFCQPHADPFGLSGGNVLADEIRFDGQLAVSAVDEHGQLNAPGPAEIIQRVHGGPDGPAAEQHVINKHHRLPGHVEWNNRGLDVGGGASAKVVPVHTDIQAAVGYGVAPNPRQQLAHSPRQRHSAALDANEHHLAASFVAFDNFMGNTREGALNRRGVQDKGGVRHEMQSKV